MLYAGIDDALVRRPGTEHPVNPMKIELPRQQFQRLGVATVDRIKCSPEYTD